MAFKKTKSKLESGADEYIVDSVADLKSIDNVCDMGTVALVIENSAVYIKNGSGKWVEL